MMFAVVSLAIGVVFAVYIFTALIRGEPTPKYSFTIYILLFITGYLSFLVSPERRDTTAAGLALLFLSLTALTAAIFFFLDIVKKQTPPKAVIILLLLFNTAGMIFFIYR